MKSQSRLTCGSGRGSMPCASSVCFLLYPRIRFAQTIGKQVLRSGTSVGAHYRESVRARSDAEIVSKWEVALQELDETSYWIELLADSELLNATRLVVLQCETNELIAILTTCVKKVKGYRA